MALPHRNVDMDVREPKRPKFQAPDERLITMVPLQRPVDKKRSLRCFWSDLHGVLVAAKDFLALFGTVSLFFFPVFALTDTRQGSRRIP